MSLKTASGILTSLGIEWATAIRHRRRFHFNALFVPMKPKIIAVLVVGILTLSVIATAVAAIGQAVGEEPGAATTALVIQTHDFDGIDNDSGLVSSLKLICPFH